MIAKDTIQNIQNRIDIVEIISQFVKLKRRGSNHIGNCPFHNEKSPSFSVSQSKEIYKCFGCGKSGNAITFLMEHEKHSYVEALRWLANFYQIEIEETKASPEQIIQNQTAESLHIINQFAGNYFKDTLWKSDEGKSYALSYCRDRGFEDHIIEKFMIGYNPKSGQEFSNKAIEQKYNTDLLAKSGLSVFRNEQWNDNYKGRIIFPIHNNTGKIIGFGARILIPNDKAPKYINTPENEVYLKSKLLYGMYFARQAIDKQGECLLVEGYTDVIALHQAGFENVVASGGTSLTIDQLLLIKKYTKYLTIVYDGDSAGIKAATKGLDMALEQGLRVQLLLIPNNEDPDSYIKKNGADAFTQLIATQKKDILLFQLETGLADAKNDSYKKNNLVNKIAETISKISKAEDFSLQQDYIKKSAELLQIEEAGMIQLVNQFIRTGFDKKQNNFQAPIEETPIPETNTEEKEKLLFDIVGEEQEKAFIKILVSYGLKPWNDKLTVAEYCFQVFDDNGLEELFDNQKLLEIYNLYKKMYLNNEAPDYKKFAYLQDASMQQILISIMESNYEVSENWSKLHEIPMPSLEDTYLFDTETSVNYLLLRKTKKLIAENQKDFTKDLPFEEQLILLKTHQHLKEIERSITEKIGTVIYK